MTDYAPFFASFASFVPLRGNFKLAFMGIFVFKSKCHCPVDIRSPLDIMA